MLSVEAVPAPAGAAAVRVLGRQVDFVLDAGYFRFDDRVYTLAAGPYLARDTLFRVMADDPRLRANSR